jgi:hypothetical protein
VEEQGEADFLGGPASSAPGDHNPWFLGQFNDFEPNIII